MVSISGSATATYNDGTSHTTTFDGFRPLVQPPG
jgi:hypothetical protein